MARKFGRKNEIKIDPLAYNLALIGESGVGKTSVIKEYCEKNIAKYALPYAYGYRKELPKTKLGKVAYKELINGENDDEEE